MSSSTHSDSLPRVLGVLIARNEWPLLGISITHALVNHVDELIVVDHASTDETQAGLAALQKRWGNKIQVFQMADGTLHHEETNLILKSMYQDRDFDWVYHIDADEFLITPNRQPLKELLASIPSEFTAARYQLHNFLVPSDFVENDFRRYGEICEKAVVAPNFELTHKDIFDSIMQGGLNFFDVPFLPKVIFRLPLDSWPVAGSHAISGMHPEKEFNFDDEHTFVAHLPFLTVDRLERRARHGKELAAAGYSRDHGWQSQVVNHMQAQGKLEEYWKRVSIPTGAPSLEIGTPRTTVDNRLTPVVESAVAELLSTIDSADSMDSVQQPRIEASVGMTKGIESIRAMSQQKQAEIKAVRAEIDSAHVHISNLDKHIQTLQEQLQEQAAQNSAQREEIFNSISWRATTGLRLIHRLIKAR